MHTAYIAISDEKCLLSYWAQSFSILCLRKFLTDKLDLLIGQGYRPSKKMITGMAIWNPIMMEVRRKPEGFGTSLGSRDLSRLFPSSLQPTSQPADYFHVLNIDLKVEFDIGIRHLINYLGHCAGVQIRQSFRNSCTLQVYMCVEIHFG